MYTVHVYLCTYVKPLRCGIRGDVSFVSSMSVDCRGYDLRVSLPDKFNTSPVFFAYLKGTPKYAPQMASGS